MLTLRFGADGLASSILADQVQGYGHDVRNLNYAVHCGVFQRSLFIPQGIIARREELAVFINILQSHLSLVCQ